MGVPPLSAAFVDRVGTDAHSGEFLSPLETRNLKLETVSTAPRLPAESSPWRTASSACVPRETPAVPQPPRFSLLRPSAPGPAHRRCLCSSARRPFPVPWQLLHPMPCPRLHPRSAALP